MATNRRNRARRAGRGGAAGAANKRPPATKTRGSSAQRQPSPKTTPKKDAPDMQQVRTRLAAIAVALRENLTRFDDMVLQKAPTTPSPKPDKQAPAPVEDRVIDEHEEAEKLKAAQRNTENPFNLFAGNVVAPTSEVQDLEGGHHVADKQGDRGSLEIVDEDEDEDEDEESDEEGESFFEQLRRANISRNQEVLKSLGLSKDDLEKKLQREEKRVERRKRQRKVYGTRDKNPRRKARDGPPDDDDEPLTKKSSKSVSKTGKQRKRRTKEEADAERESKRLKREAKQNAKEAAKALEMAKYLGDLPAPVQKLYREIDLLYETLPRTPSDCSTLQAKDYLKKLQDSDSEASGAETPSKEEKLKKKKPARKHPAAVLLAKELRIIVPYRISSVCADWVSGKSWRWIKGKLNTKHNPTGAEDLLARIVSDLQDLHPARTKDSLRDLVMSRLQQARPNRYAHKKIGHVHSPWPVTPMPAPGQVVISLDSDSDEANLEPENSSPGTFAEQLQDRIKDLDPRQLLKLLNKLPEDALRQADVDG